MLLTVTRFSSDALERSQEVHILIRLPRAVSIIAYQPNDALHLDMPELGTGIAPPREYYFLNANVNSASERVPLALYSRALELCTP